MRGGMVLLIAASVALGGSLEAQGAPRPRGHQKRGRPSPKSLTSRSTPSAAPLRPEAPLGGVASIPSPPPGIDALAVSSVGPATSSLAEPGDADRLTGISLEVTHHFDRAVARVRVSQLLQFWRDAYGVVSEWRGDRVVMQGHVHGVDIHALFDVSDGVVSAVARDPGWIWRAKAHSYVAWMLKKYLHPTYQEPPEGW